MDTGATSPFWLDSCMIDPLEGLVTTGSGEISQLQKKPMAVLMVLVAAHGRVVPSEEIIEAVWGQYSGGDEGLKRCIYAIRKSLGDSSTSPRMIRTVRGRGYACVPTVRYSEPIGKAAPPLLTCAPDTDTVAKIEQNRLVTVVSIVLTHNEADDLIDARSLPDELIKDYMASLEHFESAYPYQLGMLSNILFGLRVTKDDDHLAALELALEFREITRRYEGFRAQIGIATRDTDCTSHADFPLNAELYHGVIRAAAAIAASGAPDAITLCDTTTQLCSRHLHSLTGSNALPNFVRQYHVQDTFVRCTEVLGRDAELIALQDCWVRASRGDGNVCFVSGDAGIGKSTLCDLLMQKVNHVSGSVIRCACLSRSSNVPLHPVVDLVNHLLGLNAIESASEKALVVEDYLTSLGITDHVSTMVLAEFLQLDTARTKRIEPPSAGVRRNILLEVFSRMSVNPRGDPHLLVFDDIQWADDTTLDLLNRLVEQVPSTKTMLLVIGRSESHPEWINRPHVKHINLPPIEKDQAARIVRAIDAGNVLDERAINRVIEHAAGNPLFVREITRTVLSIGAAVDSMDEILSMPVRQLLTARVDAMGDEKNVLLHASVIGFQFSLRLLEPFMRLSRSSIEDGLRILRNANMIHQTGSYPTPVFEFNHSLLHKTVYQSIAAPTVKSLHRTLAEIIECDPEQPDKSLLAFHFEAGEEYEKAARYWLESAQRAKLNSFLSVASNYYERAAVTIQRMRPAAERDELELQMRMEFGPVLMSQKGYAHERVRENYLIAERLIARRVQKGSDFEALALFGLWSYKVVSGDLHQAKVIGENMLETAVICQNTEMAMEAYLLLGVTQTHLADYDDAVTKLKLAISLYDPVAHAHHKHLFGQDPGMAANIYCGLALAQCGNLIEASRYVSQGLIIARRSEHANSLCFALVVTGRIVMTTGDLDTMLHRAREAQALAMESEFPLWESAARFLIHAHDYLRLGDASHVYLMLETLAQCRLVGNSLSYLDFASMVANALIDIGDLAEAGRVISAAKAEMDRRIKCSDEIAVRAVESRLQSITAQTIHK